MIGGIGRQSIKHHTIILRIGNNSWPTCVPHQDRMEDKNRKCTEGFRIWQVRSASYHWLSKNGRFPHNMIVKAHKCNPKVRIPSDESDVGR